jgi:hypothetical protein
MPTWLTVLMIGVGLAAIGFGAYLLTGRIRKGREVK